MAFARREIRNPLFITEYFAKSQKIRVGIRYQAVLPKGSSSRLFLPMHAISSVPISFFVAYFVQLLRTLDALPIMQPVVEEDAPFNLGNRLFLLPFSEEQGRSPVEVRAKG